MFYDEISSYYDEMIPFEKRVQNLQTQLSPLVKKYGIKSALDIGSATGATCIALAQLGVESAGLEQAGQMVKIARQHSRTYDRKILFRQGDALDRSVFNRKFEAIFILANTISHILDKKSLYKLLANFKHWLIPGGLVAIQLLNYRRILSKRERIVKIYNNEQRTFIRFYDFGEKLINFNLLTVENQPGTCDYKLSSVPLRGWQPSEIRAALEGKGFTKIKQYANLKSDRFIPTKSNDIVYIAQRS